MIQLHYVDFLENFHGRYIVNIFKGEESCVFNGVISMFRDSASGPKASGYSLMEKVNFVCSKDK